MIITIAQNSSIIKFTQLRFVVVHIVPANFYTGLSQSMVVINLSLFTLIRLAAIMTGYINDS